MLNNIYFNVIVSLVLLLAFYKIAFANIIKEMHKIRYLRKNGIKVIGKIVDIESSADLDGLKTYRPIIEYTTLGGKVFSFKPIDGKMSIPRLNSAVPVLYDQDNQDKAIVDNPANYRFTIFKMAVILLVFCFLLFVLFRNIILII
jgi:Protein of unknown function (DUF3592)